MARRAVSHVIVCCSCPAAQQYRQAMLHAPVRLSTTICKGITPIFLVIHVCKTFRINGTCQRIDAVYGILGRTVTVVVRHDIEMIFLHRLHMEKQRITAKFVAKLLCRFPLHVGRRNTSGLSATTCSIETDVSAVSPTIAAPLRRDA